MEAFERAWVLLKNDEIPDWGDYPVIQCEMCDRYLDDEDYHVLNDHHYCSDCVAAI